MEYYIGIDIGSTSTKTAVLDAEARPVLLFVMPTGWSSIDTAETVRRRLREEGIDPAECACVATGYGRIAVPYANKTVTEITCHARGAMEIFQSGDITVIEAIPEKILPELLPFVIQNDRLFDYAVEKSAGSLSPRVKWEHLKNYEFELPETGQQKELVDLLWAMARAKKATRS